MKGNYSRTREVWGHLALLILILPVEDSSSSNGQGHHHNQIGEESEGAEHQVCSLAKPCLDDLKQRHTLDSEPGPGTVSVVLGSDKKWFLRRELLLTWKIFELSLISYGRVFYFATRVRGIWNLNMSQCKMWAANWNARVSKHLIGKILFQFCILLLLLQILNEELV